MTPIFYIKDGNLSFADKIVLSNLELYVYPGDKICLVGRNGSGKSSLMKIIEGEYELDSGELFKDPLMEIGYLKQDMHFKKNSSIYEFVLEGSKNYHPEGQKTHPERSMGFQKVTAPLPPRNLNQVQDDSMRYLADIILSKLKIDGNLELKNCSGGQVRRAFLAKALVNQPAILLLDEPTNHLDITAIEWLEEYVKSYQGAIICISHDRTFQENITNKVWWIDRGELRKSNRGFKYYDTWRDEIIAEEEAMLRKMTRKLEVEKDWLNGGVTARRKRNQKRLANLHRLRESLVAHQSKLSSAKAKLQIELLEEAKKTQFIIEAENVSFGYSRHPERGDVGISQSVMGLPQPLHGLAMTHAIAPSNDDLNLFNNFSFRVKKGEKIGVIGPNGSGKSTFIKILTKELEPLEGKVKHGSNLEITYFDQHRTQINKDHTIKMTLCPGGGDQIFLKNRSLHVAAYLKNFMFDPKIANDKVATLSGGEANRLLLAKALIAPGNFLILDEPTNDLDMDSLEMLLEILAEYDGTLLVVSHDRDFLDRLVTRTLVFTGEKIIDLYGGYQDYLKFYQPFEVKKPRPETKKRHLQALNRHPEALAEWSQEAKANNNSKPKLSYKYQRLLDVLPLEIEALEEKIKDMENKLMQGDLYSKQPEKFAKYSQDLEEAHKLLDEKLQRWIEVENMRV